MKIRYLDDFDEDLLDKDNQRSHYQKHKKECPEWTEEECKKHAEDLTLKPVDNKNIFGYMSKDKQNEIAYVKWDKDAELFVVYNYKENQPCIITSNRKSKREYEGEKWDNNYGYFDEIPVGN